MTRGASALPNGSGRLASPASVARRILAPPHGATGWVGVELVSLDETVGGGSFFYEARATVSLVLPLLGPVEGGSRLTVLGSHFRESSALACRFGHGSGAVAVAARFVSAAQLEAMQAQIDHQIGSVPVLPTLTLPSLYRV